MRSGKYLKDFTLAACCLMLTLYNYPARAQVINTVQHLSFGAFYRTSNAGGTVVVSPEGSRSFTGQIAGLALAIPFHNAIFELEAEDGAIISVTLPQEVRLTGSNGGFMNLQPGPSNPVSPFITSLGLTGRTEIQLGGVLTVGNLLESPPGSYTGTFYITINNE